MEVLRSNRDIYIYKYIYIWKILVAKRSKFKAQRIQKPELLAGGLAHHPDIREKQSSALLTFDRSCLVAGGLVAAAAAAAALVHGLDFRSVFF